MWVFVSLAGRLVKEIKRMTSEKHAGPAISIALEDYVRRQKLREHISRLKEDPLQFQDDFTAERIRELNRKSEIS